MGTVNYQYGDLLPAVSYPDYEPDEIDQVNSDMQAMVVVYGAGNLDTANENVPCAFLIAGQNDEHRLDESSVRLYLQLKERGISTDLHIFADCVHGFGLANGFPISAFDTGVVNETNMWNEMAVKFLDIQFGHMPRYSK